MQFTDEQIMHYFEICEEDEPRCAECLCEDDENISCFQKLRHDVIGVYNRQKAEIERLKKEPYQFADIGKMHSKVKAEAIKEFAERLRRTIVDTPFGVNCSGESEDYKDGCLHGLVAKQHNILDVLENLLKEMLGELDDDIGRQHHYVKILPEYYILIDEGIKTFEIRFNDRDYKVGDILHLQEFCGGEYTGRVLEKEICYMIDSPDYCKDRFVVLGIKNI